MDDDILILTVAMNDAELAAWTTEEERATVAGFRNERRRYEYLTWRAIVRQQLGREVAITYNTLGAPEVDCGGVFISVAHCRDCVAVRISGRCCAVDVEPTSRDFSKAASRYVSSSEQMLSQSPLLNGLLWCAKETLYKYSGRNNLNFLTDLRVDSIHFDANPAAVGTDSVVVDMNTDAALPMVTLPITIDDSRMREVASAARPVGGVMEGRIKDERVQLRFRICGEYVVVYI